MKVMVSDPKRSKTTIDTEEGDVVFVAELGGNCQSLVRRVSIELNWFDRKPIKTDSVNSVFQSVIKEVFLKWHHDSTWKMVAVFVDLLNKRYELFTWPNNYGIKTILFC